MLKITKGYSITGSIFLEILSNSPHSHNSGGAGTRIHLWHIGCQDVLEKEPQKLRFPQILKLAELKKPIVSRYYFWLVAPYYIQLTQHETSMAHAIANSHKTQF